MLGSFVLVALAAPVSAAERVLVVDGAVAGARSFAPADLLALPRATAERDDHGLRIACEGVALIDILARAGLPGGDAVRGPALSTVIVATARDGYRVAFTLGELDRALGNLKVIVADRCHGKPLDAMAGPFRLLVPGDKRGARSVRQLERLTITAAARP